MALDNNTPLAGLPNNCRQVHPLQGMNEHLPRLKRPATPPVPVESHVKLTRFRRRAAFVLYHNLVVLPAAVRSLGAAHDLRKQEPGKAAVDGWPSAGWLVLAEQGRDAAPGWEGVAKGAVESHRGLRIGLKTDCKEAQTCSSLQATLSCRASRPGVGQSSYARSLPARAAETPGSRGTRTTCRNRSLSGWLKRKVLSITIPRGRTSSCGNRTVAQSPESMPNDRCRQPSSDDLPREAERPPLHRSVAT